jgi:cytosine/adenosine deaminase-related metal-dependent hydrolase
MSVHSSTPVAVQARWVVPIDQPPIERGVVTLTADKIVAVGENQSGKPPVDLGNVILLPRLVNAHTHLEFSLLNHPLGEPGMAFPDWIARVIEYRKVQAKTLMVETDGFQRFRRKAAERGLAELRDGACVAVGDIATPGWPRECFPAQGLHAVVFLELLGLDPQRQSTMLSMAESFVEDLQATGPKVQPGISPHAPYTVTPELVQRVAELSAKERFPVAMHLAESREELELLTSHSGKLVETLASVKAWNPAAIPRGITPRHYLELLAKAHHALVIHGNYLAADDWEILASRRERMSVVYCPRTHAYFGHEAYPLAALLTAGVRVAVGTDSLASNPDLSLLAELRHIAASHSSVAPATILQMGTLDGATALGLSERLGSITSGKISRLATMAVDPTASDPYAAIFAGSGAIKSLTSIG